MKWIVFVLGLALLAGGFAAMWQGYGIVEVERGWTLVISGTVAFSAGVVTIALGIVAGRIDALSISMAAKLVERPREPATDSRKWNDPLLEVVAAGSVAPPVPVVPVAEIATEEPMVPVAADVSAAPDELAVSVSTEVAQILPEEPAPPTVPADTAIDLSALERALQLPAVPSEAAAPVGKRPIFGGWRTNSPGKTDFSAPAPRADVAPAKARRPTFAAPPPTSSKSLSRRGAWPPAPFPRATEPEPAELAPQVAQEPSPAVAVEEKKGKYDWLEQALAGAEPKTESSMPQVASETEAAISSAPAVEHEAPAAPVGTDTEANGADFGEADHVAVEAAPPQPVEPDPVSLSEPVALAAVEAEVPAEPAQSASPVAPASPAIIGRYESNGASYVLYADGTIDATTQNGVFHFASMAELKVFIENKT